MRNACLVVSLGLLCSFLEAQPGRKVTKVGNAVDLVALGPSTTPGSVFAAVTPTVDQIEQINVLPDLDAAGNRVPGKFQLNMTVVRGGGGGSQLMLGVLDTTTNPWTFTENTATLLPGEVVVGLKSVSMLPDLLSIYCDGPTNVRWATRASRSVPFQALVDTTLGSGDAKVLVADGFRFISYRQTTSLHYIIRSSIDPARYPNDPRTQSSFNTLVPPPLLDAHDGDFLLDQAGNARAVAHSVDMGGPGSMKRARPWFNPIVRPANRNVFDSKQFHDGPNDDTEMVRCGALAGSLIYPTQPPGGIFGVPKMINVVASCGSEVPAAGGTFHLSAWLPFFDRNNPPSQPWAVTILLGAPGPDITVPGFAGKLALALTPAFIALPARSWSANTLSADWAVAAPPLPAGTELWGQTLAFDPAQSFNGVSFYFGNTAPLYWY